MPNLRSFKSQNGRFDYHCCDSSAVLLKIHNGSKLPNDIFGDINRKYIIFDLQLDYMIGNNSLDFKIRHCFSLIQLLFGLRLRVFEQHAVVQLHWKSIQTLSDGFYHFGTSSDIKWNHVTGEHVIWSIWKLHIRSFRTCATVFVPSLIFSNSFYTLKR